MSLSVLLPPIPVQPLRHPHEQRHASKMRDAVHVDVEKPMGRHYNGVAPASAGDAGALEGVLPTARRLRLMPELLWLRFSARHGL